MLSRPVLDSHPWPRCRWQDRMYESTAGVCVIHSSAFTRPSWRKSRQYSAIRQAYHPTRSPRQSGRTASPASTLCLHSPAHTYLCHSRSHNAIIIHPAILGSRGPAGSPVSLVSLLQRSARRVLHHRRDLSSLAARRDLVGV